LYLRAGESERDQMRQFFAATYSLQWRVWRVSGEAATDAERSGSPDSLRLALGALSLEDGVSDCRDTYLALGTLSQIAATRAIDWQTIEDEIAALSSPRMRSLLKTRTLDMRDFA